MSEPFNPLAMDNLAESIVSRLMATEPTPLGEVSRFAGAGLYAIYYFGDHPAYAELVAADRELESPTHPIYVGKAIPAGGRRGLDPLEHTTTFKLSARLGEHAQSVRDAENLDVADFSARWLVVEDIWIPLGESALIRRYRPVWNALVDGFGNHDPGRHRRTGMRSRWDTLHAGRSWISDLTTRRETAADIEQEVHEYLRSRL